jgi:hypothetical protein
MSDANSERARISAILNSSEASGRDELARHLAFNTAQTADDAIALLKVSNKSSATSAAAAPVAAAAPDYQQFFAALMAQVNPTVPVGVTGAVAAEKTTEQKALEQAYAYAASIGQLAVKA